MDRTISHYRIIESLGSGGMGHIFKAMDLRLGRIVAVKFLPPQLFPDSETSRRLLEEAQAAAALGHPGIAATYDVDQDDTTPFIVMEYVEGETLAIKLAKEPLGTSAALDISIEAADALKAAHARGLIHCDLKSSNIMITPEGHVKILDFGMARLRDPSQDSLHAAPHPPLVAGTAGYMSPEQIKGIAPDERTDIFSLGVVVYEMITGRRPFEGRSPAAIMESTLHSEPLPRAGQDKNLIVNEPAHFDGSQSYDPDGSIASYHWDFGDGGTAAGPSVRHSYIAAGTYTVILTVVDNKGAAAADTATVIVRDVSYAINSLTDLVTSYNLKQGIANSLYSKIQSVLAAFSAANSVNRQDVANKLQALVNSVEAQRGKELTNAQADALELLAKRILRIL